MANTSSRMLRLLSLLQTHRYWPGLELAERLEVSPRTVRRDIDRLRELGYPVDANRGVDGGYQLQAGASLPPLLLEDDEAVAIAVGLQSAAGGAVGGIEESSIGALSKIVQVMPARLKRRVDALTTYTVSAPLGGGQTIDATLLTTIAQCCRDDERLRFGYRRRDGEQMVRLVEPHRLVSHGRRWYLVAFDVDRSEWRTFRVDRMSEPRATGARFRQRELPADDAAAYVRASIASVPMRHDVEVVVRASASEVAHVVRRWGSVEPIDETSCVLRMTTDTLDWPAMVLGAVGADFTVVTPVELRDYCRELGERFQRSAAGE